MMKAIFKDEVKDISYGMIKYNVSSIIPCDVANNNIRNGTMVTLAAFTKNGLKVIQSRIGKVIKANDNSVRVKFNTSFGFDNQLYAIMTAQSNLKTPSALVLAYSEV